VAQVVNLDALVTPNWTLNLPGSLYLGDDPEGHVHRDQIVAYRRNTLPASRCRRLVTFSHQIPTREQIKGWADKMCADPDSRSKVLAWAMRGRCPVEQGGIGNAREVEGATAQVRDSMDEFQSFVSTARSAERSFHQQLDASCGVRSLRWRRARIVV
jgi:hypothetical protein